VSLRDLFVSFGINYDGKGAKKAGDDLDKLGKKTSEFFTDAQGLLKHVSGRFATTAEKIANGMGGGIGGWALNLNQGLELAKKGFHAIRGVAEEVFEVLEAGSSAQETDNLLREVFKTGVDGVKEFARVSGQEIGRSQFQLEKYAGIIGALVSPQLQSMGEAGQKAAADISKDFSVLAIDLASFFNTSEDEALTALRSGVSGETEPLKRFGINLTEEGVSNALGISKKQFRQMNVAQKTLARYQAVMKLTVNAQGDAARTADGYANTVRALESAWMDLKTTLGEALIPIGTKVAAVLRDTFLWAVKNKDTIAQYARGMAFFAGTVLVGLLAKLAATTLSYLALNRAMLISRATAFLTGKVFTVAGLQAAGAAILAALPWVILGAILVATALFLEDIWVSLNGGQGVIAGIVDQILGWKGAFMDLANAMYEVSFFDAWVEGFQELYDIVEKFFSGKISKLMDLGARFFGPTAGEQAASARARVHNAVNPAAPTASSGAAGAVTNAPIFNVNVNGVGGNARDTGREVERGLRRFDAERNRGIQQGT
jgi:hypothetical protein